MAHEKEPPAFGSLRGAALQGYAITLAPSQNREILEYIDKVLAAPDHAVNRAQQYRAQAIELASRAKAPAGVDIFKLAQDYFDFITKGEVA